MNYPFNLFILLVLAASSGTTGADVVPSNCKAAQILRLLTKWRNGDVPALPPLDVIKVPSVEGTYNEYGVKVAYTTGDMLVTGASNFTVEAMQINVFTKDSKKILVGSAKAIIPLVILTSDQYNLQGKAYYLYNLKGSGVMNVTFQNIEITVGATLVSKQDSELIEELNLGFKIGNIKITLSDSSWPVNKILNSQALNIAEKHRKSLEEAAQETLKLRFNEFLETTTSLQLLGTAGDDDCGL